MLKRFALIACISTPLWAQNATFGTSLYPVMEKAACRSCHTSNFSFSLAASPVTPAPRFDPSMATCMRLEIGAA